MVTNFEHLASQKDMFDKMIFVEDMLVDGESKEEYVQAMSAMRGVLDIMMKNWVRVAGLSDTNIIAYVNEKFTDKSNSVNLFGRIYALERIGVINRNTADILHDIRKVGNDSVHYGETILAMSKDMAYNKAVTMYTEIYNTTYEYLSYVQSKAGAADSYAGASNTANAGNSNGRIKMDLSGIQLSPSQEKARLRIAEHDRDVNNTSKKRLLIAAVIETIVFEIFAGIITSSSYPRPTYEMRVLVFFLILIGVPILNLVAGAIVLAIIKKDASKNEIIIASLMNDTQAEVISGWSYETLYSFFKSLNKQLSSTGIAYLSYDNPIVRSIAKEYIDKYVF